MSGMCRAVSRLSACLFASERKRTHPIVISICKQPLAESISEGISPLGDLLRAAARALLRIERSLSASDET